MKKFYEAPTAERVVFCYSDQVVASGCGPCSGWWFKKEDLYYEHPEYGNKNNM